MNTPLLTTKLFPPPPAIQRVSRPRLVERVIAALDQRRKLVLVSAPAGFGKTTLVVEACQQADRGLAWLSLDAADNDLSRFWRYVIAAFQRAAALQRAAPQGARETLGELAQAMLVEIQPPPVDSILTGLLNDLAGLETPLLLVLDDYHVIETPAIHESLNFFLDHLPPAVTLVLTTRADPPLALARRRGRMEMIEIRAAELRFTTGEALEFLNAGMKLGLPPGDVETLLRRTEGWAAGLQMAALAMQGLVEGGEFSQGSPDALHAFVTTFAGDDQYIGDYLVEEVLQRQPGPVQQFLLKTSILERLSGPLCNAVLGVEDAQATLVSLERANLFLSQLDNRQEWFRYHRLFAELLQRRLAQAHGLEVERELHARASRWFQEHGFWAEAVEHALQAGDPARAASLVGQSSAEFFTRSEQVLLLDLVHKLPEDQVSQRPGLCVQWAWAALSTGRADECRRAIQVAERAPGICIELLSQGPEALLGLHPGLVNVVVNIACMRAALVLADMEVKDAIRLSRQVLDCLEAWENQAVGELSQDMRPVAYFNLGMAYEALGEAEPASSALSEAVTWSWRTKNVHLLPLAASHLAQIQLTRGQLVQALETYRQALQMASELTGRPSPLVSVAHAGLGRLYYERNELDLAREHFERGLAFGKPWRNWESLTPIYLGLARLYAQAGDRAGALALLADARRLWEETYHREPMAAFNAWSALIAEDPVQMSAAARQLEKGGPPPEIFAASAAELDTHLRARLWMELGEYQKCADLLAGSLAQAEAGERQDIVIRALVLQADLLQRLDRQDEALETLARALALAEPGGYVRVFLDQGSAVRRLLAALAGRRDENAALAGFAARLLAEAGQEKVSGGDLPAQRSAVTTRAAAKVLVEPLTGRELEILHLLAEGLSNSQIATRLVITPGTVKVHTNNLYAKLEVNSRTAAVARARDLGILK